LSSQFGGAAQFDDLTAVGDLGARLLAQVPEAMRTQVEPLIPPIVHGVYEAFSLGIANTMWLGLIATVIAAAATVTLTEVSLRSRPRSHAAAARPLETAATD
jgi:hypothetical protein